MSLLGKQQAQTTGFPGNAQAHFEIRLSKGLTLYWTVLVEAFHVIPMKLISFVLSHVQVCILFFKLLHLLLCFLQKVYLLSKRVWLTVLAVVS